MKKKSCSRCKQLITGVPYKLGGSLLCDKCYPFCKNEDGKWEFKKGQEGSLTFGRYGGFNNPSGLVK